MQVCVYNVDYLTYCPPGSNFLCLLDTLKCSHLPEDIVVNLRVQERLKVTYGKTLEYMDTHRDRQVLKAVMATLTSTPFVAKLQGISSWAGTANAKQSEAVLPIFDRIKQTSQIVRNDLTHEQQHQLYKGIVSARKVKEIKTIAGEES